MKAWTAEANTFYIGTDTEKHILMTNEIKSYLKIEDENYHDNKFFLVGAKGFGKTLLLRYKSYKYNLRTAKYDFTKASEELTENLLLRPSTFGKDDLLKFRDINIWETVWEVSLWTHIFNISRLPLHKTWSNIISSNRKKLSSIVTDVLKNRSSLGKFKEIITDYIDRADEIKSGIAIFIDDIDQSLQNILQDSDNKMDDDATEIWINAQLALINVVFNIFRQNHHIKIFATIRSEAWACFNSPQKANISEHITELEYSKFDLKIIFEKNIEMMPTGELTLNSGKNLVKKFLGFDETNHRFVYDKNDLTKFQVEDVFNFIYRHTFGRPRDIIRIGGALHSLICSESYKSYFSKGDIAKCKEEFRAKVNNKSSDLFNEYKSEIVPFFDTEEFEVFIDKINGNLIQKNEINEISTSTLSKYLMLGLIGYPKEVDVVGRLIQFFETPAKKCYKMKFQLPTTSYYFTHSSLDQQLTRIYAFANYYNEFNIIGNGYEFTIPPKLEIKDFHFSDYKPICIASNRADSANEAAKHQEGLSVYYDLAFSDIGTNICKRYDHDINNAIRILTFLARLCYLKQLEKKTNNDFYRIEQGKFTNNLKTDYVTREYLAQLKSKADTQNTEKFLNRLYGRFITLGAYLILDIPLNILHKFLMQKEFKLAKATNGTSLNTPHSYLMRSFFIDGLQKKVLKNHETDINDLNGKKKIFDSLSYFEKTKLIKFYLDSVEEVKNGQWFASEDDRTWLLTNIIPKVWNPTSANGK